MKTSMKFAIGAVVAGVAGIAGYYGYKAYKASKEPSVGRLGAFTDGYVDYNAQVASAYWKRQHELYNDRLRLSSMRGY